MYNWIGNKVIKVWTKYGEPRVYACRENDLIVKTCLKLNKVSRPYKWLQGHVRYARLTCTLCNECVDQI